MLRRSPSRSSRTKGIKVKHVFQILLLLGICFWLIYLLKHSRDTENRIHVKDVKLSVGGQIDGNVPKLGRKNLHPHVEDGIRSDKHGKQEEGEEEERKNEKTEDEGTEGRETETDENYSERIDGEAEHDSELIDEGKEKKKEEEIDVKRGRVIRGEEKESRNTHKAREEQYKGDDASSAVAHHTQTVISKKKNPNIELLNDISAKDTAEQEKKYDTTREINGYHNISRQKNGEGTMTDNRQVVNITISYKANDNLSSTMNGSRQNSTQSNDQPKANTRNNSTEVRNEILVSSQQNGTETLLHSVHNPEGENISIFKLKHTDNSNIVSKTNRFNSNSLELSAKAEHYEPTVIYSNSSRKTGSIISEALVESMISQVNKSGGIDDIKRVLQTG